jgi:hypothetical protein
MLQTSMHCCILRAAAKRAEANKLALLSPVSLSLLASEDDTRSLLTVADASNGTCFCC